jgi:hypothetical protein
MTALGGTDSRARAKKCVPARTWHARDFPCRMQLNQHKPCAIKDLATVFATKKSVTASSSGKKDPLSGLNNWALLGFDFHFIIIPIFNRQFGIIYVRAWS